VHDIADLEGRGVPSMFVASTEFVEAASAQVRSIGLDVRRVFVPHPIQDRTDDELRALADAAVDDILATLVTTADR
jgi:hypothetical protein